MREISDIPPQKDSGLKFGFDYDTFKDIVLTGVGIGASTATTGVGAMSILALTVRTLAVAGLGGLAKGSYNETMAAREQTLQAMSPEVDLSALETSLKGIDEKIQGVQRAMEDKAAIDFSELTAPLSAIDEKTQSILQAMQNEQPYEADRLQELFGTLPNIEEYTKSILL